MRFIVDDEAFTLQPLHDAGHVAGGAPASWFDDTGFAMLSRWWTQTSWQRKYSYRFNWLGRPIIQLPGDIVMMQEIIWRTRPTLIIETGVAHGGSAIFHASILRLIHDRAANGASRPRVIAIDIEIRPHNRAAIEAHALSPMITLMQGSSTQPSIINSVAGMLTRDDRVMVVLDSDHSRDHVAAELKAYAPMVSPGYALVVMDGVMPMLANLPAGQREWTHDHPAAAIAAFQATPLGREFEIDRSLDGHGPTHSPGGVLIRRNSKADPR